MFVSLARLKLILNLLSASTEESLSSQIKEGEKSVIKSIETSRIDQLLYELSTKESTFKFL